MKTLQKILSILMIIVLMTTDFSVLGIGLKSYAADNTENVEFSAYFTTENGTKVEKINQDVTKQDLKLHLTISVKNEGYFNGSVKIGDGNFKIDTTQKIENTMVAKVEENAISLKQINAGETANIEVPVKMTNAEEISTNILSKDTTLSLEGTYIKASAKSNTIGITKTVTVNMVPSTNANAEIETNVITNIKTKVGEETKRVIQLYVKTRLANNEYPVKKTEISVVAPFAENKPEKVEAMALKTTATNNEDTKVINDISNDNGKVTFSVENKENDSKIIKWKKDAWDEFVVTFIYDENTTIKNDSIENYNKINTQVNITLYNNEEKIISAQNQTEVNEEKINSLIVKENSSKTEMYKGKLYSNTTSYYPEEIPYMDTTTVYLTEADIINSIVVTESEEKFVTNTEELSANSIYKTTQVNKAQVLDILGENGELSIIYDGNIFTINKDTEANTAGNVILTYDDEISKIGVITTNPVKNGKIDFIHTKALEDNEYTREQLKQVNSMKNTVSVAGIQGENEIVKDVINRNIELKETETKAELTIVDNKGSLSTLQENKLVLGVKLVTDGEQYDLFKNAGIRINLPKEVEKVEITNADKLYAEGFAITAGYDKNNKAVALVLIGEQIDYPATLATQIYLQIELNVKLSKTAPNKTSKITMEYVNENATRYYGQSDVQVLDADEILRGYAEQEINISSPTGVISTLNSDTYQVETMTMVESEGKTIEITKDQAGKDVNFDLTVINNTQTDMKNVKVEVQLPTCGKTELDVIKTKLKNIEANGAKIYYTQNEQATVDITKEENGWKTELDADSKKVLLVLNDTLAKETNFESKLTLTLPSEIPTNVETELKYKTVYDTDSEQNVETESNAIKIVTPKEIKMETSMSATVGGNELKNGDKVRVGDVITYTISVKNIGTQTIRNVTLNGEVPTGTELANTDTKATYTIEELKSNETFSRTYELRVTEKVDEISNKATASCSDVTEISAELKNEIETAKISVKIRQDVSDFKDRQNNDTTEYIGEITNFTNEEINDIELKINTNGINLKEVRIGENLYTDNLSQVIKISSIPANQTISIGIKGVISTESEKVTISLSAKDKEGEIYNSNETGEKVFKNDVKVEVTCSRENSYTDQGAYVVYKIIVTNTGTLDTNVTVKDQFSNYIEIDNIALSVLKEENGNETVTSPAVEIPESKYVDNNLSYDVTIPVGSKAQFTVSAWVQTVVGEEFKTKEISNYAVIKINKEEKKSNEIKFYMKGIDGQNYNIDSDDDNNNGNNDNNNDDNNETTKKYLISGVAWLDENKNGIREDSEKLLSGIKVKAYDVVTNDYLKDSTGKTIEVETNANGEYQITSVALGEYIILFEYDTNEYELTTYKADSENESRISSVVLKTININGQNVVCGVTDTIYLDWDTPNINIGLKTRPKFDLELNKYVSKITVQNNKGTKSYDFANKTFAKVEIDRKQLKNSTVIVEYNIQVKNAGEVEGYVSSIIDYMPSGLTFRSELNSNWYIMDGNLYTKQLENVKLQPGETKEIKLVLTKQMTEENVGLINNMAEIYEAYNEYGISDIDSTPNNKMNGEDDLGSADVYIGIKTGIQIVAYIILAVVNIVLIGIAINLVIIKKQRI